MSNHQATGLPEAEFTFLCLDSSCLVDCVLLLQFSKSRIGASKRQKKRLNALENRVTTTLSDVPNQLPKKTRDKFVFNLV